MKKTNIEKILKKHYKSEAASLELPQEGEIKALSRVKASKTQTMKTWRINRFATVSACCLVCLLVLAAFPIINQFGNPVTPLIINNGSSTPGTNPSGNKPPVTADYPNLSLLSITEWCSAPKVVWSDSDGVKGNEATGIKIERGTTKITDKLHEKMNGQDKDTVYAVMVDFSSGVIETEISAWKYEGHTIAELEAELEQLRSESKIIGNNTATGPDGVTIKIPIYDNGKELAVAANRIRDAKRDYYFNCLKNYNESFKAMGLGIYNEEAGYTIENMIFYTFATKAQLENFQCKTTEAFVFTTAVRFK